MPLIGLPTLKKNRSVSVAHSNKWAAQQTYNIGVVASARTTPSSLLDNIARNAPASYLVRVASNHSTDPSTLQYLWEERSTDAVVKRLCANPNTPVDVIEEIGYHHYYSFNPYNRQNLSSNPSTPVHVLQSFLPYHEWKSTQYPLVARIHKWQNVCRATMNILGRLGVEVYLENAWFLSYREHQAFLKKHGNDVVDYIQQTHGIKVDLEYPVGLCRVFKQHYKPS